MSVTRLQLARLRRVGGKTSVTAGSAALSQATGAAGLLALTLLGRSTADTYALGLQLGFASFAGVVIEVIYNLAIGRPEWSHWRGASLWAATASLVLTTITLIYLASTGDLTTDRGWVIALFGVGGAGLAWCATALVRVACTGRPVPLAGVAIAPNVLLAVTVLMAAWTDSGVIWPAAAWCLLNLGMAASTSLRYREASASQRFRQTSASLLHREPAAHRSHPSLGNTYDSARLHVFGLALGVVPQTVIPILLLSGATHLAAGTAIVLFFLSRVVTFGVIVGVNSVLLVRYNWTRASVLATHALVVATVAATATAACALTLHLVSPVLFWVPNGLVLLAQATLVVVSTIVLREVNHRRMARTVTSKVVLDLVLSAAGLSIYLARPTVSGFFGVYLISHCVTVLACAIGLKEYRWAGTAGAGLLISGALVVFGW